MEGMVIKIIAHFVKGRVCECHLLLSEPCSLSKTGSYYFWGMCLLAFPTPFALSAKGVLALSAKGSMQDVKRP